MKNLITILLLFTLSFSFAAVDTIILPIQWVQNLRAVGGESGTFLHWGVTNQEDVVGYEISRAREASEPFMVLGTVQPRGTMSEIVHYSFKDKNPRRGLNIYQVVAIEGDGSYTRSNLAAVYSGHSDNIEVRYYHEVKQLLIFNASPDQRVIIFDSTGMVVRKEFIQTEDAIIDFKPQTTGGYFIYFPTENVQKKFIATSNDI